MKKIKIAICLLIAALALAMPQSAEVRAAGEPSVRLNGQRLGATVQPKSVNGRFMLPLRQICDALGISLYWDPDTSTAYMSRRGAVAYHRAASRELFINGASKMFDTPSVIINDRIYMPLTMLDMMVDAEISIDSADNCVSIEYVFGEYTISVGGKTISVGQTEEELRQSFGEPNRISASPVGCDWYVYNSNYEEFILVGVDGGLVRAFYSNAKSFKYNNGYASGYVYDGLASNEHETFFTESLNGDTLYAVLVSTCANRAADYLADGERYRADEERLVAELTNAYRAAYGKPVLEYDEEISAASLIHSNDMAVRGFFGHENPDGKNPKDRLIAANIYFSACGENLAAGNSNAITSFDQWVNAASHRENMLIESYRYIGIGIAVNPGSEYQYYYTQTFLIK